jgi:hypothetical protein
MSAMNGLGVSVDILAGSWSFWRTCRRFRGAVKGQAHSHGDPIGHFSVVIPKLGKLNDVALHAINNSVLL